MVRHLPPLLNEYQASAFLDVEVTALRELRKRSLAPEPIRIGDHWYYAVCDLENFIEDIAQGFQRL